MIYLHTNTRNLSDAVEIIKFCDEIEADLVSFDLPGCGKSESNITPLMGRDLEHLIEWILVSFGTNVEIILWARGMSTAIALEYCAKFHGKIKKSNIAHNMLAQARISFLVLDSPFVSIKTMIDECLTKLRDSGYLLPNTIIHFFAGFVRRTLTQRFHGIDPYTVEPIKYASSIQLPCIIIGAANDDYIGIMQSIKFVEEWTFPFVQFKIVEQGHFQRRPEETILKIAESFSSYSTEHTHER